MVPKELISEIRKWISEGRYGNIQINFVRGQVKTWNLFQSIRPGTNGASVNADPKPQQAPKP